MFGHGFFEAVYQEALAKEFDYLKAPGLIPPYSSTSAHQALSINVFNLRSSA
jgi:hypothetical protein